MLEPRGVDGREALPRALGTGRLEALPGCSAVVLAGRNPCECYGGNAPGSMQPAIAFTPILAPVAPLHNFARLCSPR